MPDKPSTGYQTIKIRADTHPRLKLLAALMGKTMMEAVDQLVVEGLRKRGIKDQGEQDGPAPVSR